MLETRGGPSVAAASAAANGRYVESVACPTRVDIDGFDGIRPWHQRRSGIAYALGGVAASLMAADVSFRVARG